MKKFLKIFGLLFAGIILMGVASIALFVTMSYYRQPEALPCGLVLLFSFLGSLICFMSVTDIEDGEKSKSTNV